MSDDPIVRETRKHREAYAASFGYDLVRIVADLQARQGRDGRIVVDRTVAAAPTSHRADARRQDASS